MKFIYTTLFAGCLALQGCFLFSGNHKPGHAHADYKNNDRNDQTDRRQYPIDDHVQIRTGDQDELNKDEILLETSTENQEKVIYRGSRQRIFDVVHTKLDVSFDYAKKHLLGKAWITLQPHFYPSDSLDLDAKHFDIHQVKIRTGNGKFDSIPFTYKDSVVLHITLPAAFKGKKIEVYIEYTAKPEEVKQEGSAAINDAKGLYFINADGSEPDKPRQIWTQGETESNSCWFPTIDAPNQKMTQEISITADAADVTLSNGKLISSKKNPNGTHTDTWRQMKPAAPYLTMMAVGPFVITKDTWRDSLQVNYYMEKAWAPYAKLIFGNTPEMMEFYSKKLGVDYPWDKYSQVVVRDFVSGAMENVGAVVHYDALNHDSRSHLDNTCEDIICHELFHHWFGDLVTCESWSNLPLNESFATYGEYLWYEHKYGRDAADEHLYNDLKQYLSEAEYKTVPLIRFGYTSREDMFDAHSYQKGGNVLHMLRCYVGDSAFFLALNKYLKGNAYKTAEIHQLRLAFEEVTGEDLNWFFNQWFLAAGHPVVEFSWQYNEEEQKIDVMVTQNPKGHDGPFILPLDVDIWIDGEVTRQRIWAKTVEEMISIPVSGLPDLVNIDAQKMLLCSKTDFKKRKEWKALYDLGTKYLDKMEALEGLAHGELYKDEGKTPMSALENEVFTSALNHPFWGIRQTALQLLPDFELEDFNDAYFEKIKQMTVHDPKSSVREQALTYLRKFSNDPGVIQVIETCMNDSSYHVMGTALNMLAESDTQKVLDAIKPYLKSKNPALINLCLEIIGNVGKGDYTDFFVAQLGSKSGNKYNLFNAFGKYLSRQTDTAYYNKLLPVFEKNIGWYKDDWFNRWIMKSNLSLLLDGVKDRMEDEDEKPRWKPIRKKLRELDEQLDEGGSTEIIINSH